MSPVEWIKDHPYGTAGIAAGVLVVLWYMGFFGSSSQGGNSTASDYYAAQAAAAQASSAQNVAQTQQQTALKMAGVQADAAINIAGLQADVQKLGITTAADAANRTTAANLDISKLFADIEGQKSSDALSALINSNSTTLAAIENTNAINLASVTDTNAAALQSTIAGFKAHTDETSILANAQEVIAAITGHVAEHVADTTLAGQQEGAYLDAYKTRIAGLVSVGASPDQQSAAVAFTPLDLTSWKEVWPSAQDAYTKNAIAYGKAVFGPTYGT